MKRSSTASYGVEVYHLEVDGKRRYVAYTHAIGPSAPWVMRNFTVRAKSCADAKRIAIQYAKAHDKVASRLAEDAK